MKRTITAAAAGGAFLLLTATAALAQLSDADVKSAVEAKGYTNPQITNHEKSHIDVTAMKNGKPVRLAVDPQTGAVSMDRDKDEARDKR